MSMPECDKRDDDVGAGFLDLRHPGLRRLDDIAGHDIAVEVL